MKNRELGMSLIELLTALTVLGILVGIAVPSFREFTANSRTTAATNDLVSALNLARSEALRRSTTAVVCASANQTACSGASDWSTGWIVFADANGNNTVDTDELLQVWPAVGGGMLTTSTQPRVIYNAMGMGQLPGNTAITFSVRHPACTGLHAGETIVSVSGALQSKKIACP